MSDTTNDDLQNQIQQLQVQLAGCGVAALCNTSKSRQEQKLIPGDYGWSASYQDVVDAVGREIKLRDALENIGNILSTILVVDLDPEDDGDLAKSQQALFEIAVIRELALRV